MSWSRRFWGIEFIGRDGKSVLIGSVWNQDDSIPYHGEPTRALLFTTRAMARQWCKGQLVKYQGREDFCADWRFSAVAVRETVRMV